MRAYLIRRVLTAIPLLLVISIICFGLMQLAPGGPLARLQEDPRVRPEDIAIKKRLLGLDKPKPVQYALWLGRFVRGDFGESFVTKQPVAGMIGEKLEATFYLMVTSLMLALSVGLSLGIASALKRATGLDYLATLFAFVGISIPVFWLGLMSQIVFGAWLGWLPVTGAGGPGFGDIVRHLVLPVGVLSLLYMASWSRYMRGSLIEVMSLDYVRTARAKGLPARSVIMKHGVRNALIPVVTVVALQIPTLFTGAIITETVFAWPGMGRFFYDGVLKGDYPRLMAIFMISSFLIVAFNIIADVLYAVLDPRISYK